jgi:para-nitrobenzyl esterase
MSWSKLAAALGALVALSGAAFGEPVRTDAGLIEGVRQGDLIVYKGVPFAAPPVGDLRWRPPQPVKPWMGVRKADAFGPACMQAPAPQLGGTPISEDCLYLNVWRPAKASGPLPVMVFVHGGGFTAGSGSMPLVWGDNLARKGVIVVTLNFRQGAFGFLALPELSRESGKGSGDYGLMDVIAALKWIKANARAFGGDPGRITLFGQSSGSDVVSVMLASPEARGLFSRAIGESNGLFASLWLPGNVVPEAIAEPAGTALEKAVGAADLAALRRLPVETILKAPGNWWPVIDGEVITEPPYVTFSQGRQADVPTLVGSNATEGIFFAGPNKLVKAADWDRQLAPLLGDKAAEARQVYPFRTDDEAYWSQAHLYTDLAYAWHIWTWARLQSRTGHAPIRMWRLEQPWPAADPEKRKLMGTPHVAEIFYVLQHFDPDDKTMAWTAADRRIGEMMSSYWTNFARTGDPNGPGLPRWPAFHEHRQTLLRIKARPELGTPEKARMELIDAWETEVRKLGVKPPSD